MFATNFDAVFDFYFNFRVKLTKTTNKARKIVFAKLVTLDYFQKGLNLQIVDNKEIHRNLYRVKLM